MQPTRRRRPRSVALAACLLLSTGWPTAARPATPERALAEAMRGLDAIPRRTGILYDRVLPLSGIERFDGGPQSPPVPPGLWRQILHELRAASDDPGAWPAASALADQSAARLAAPSRWIGPSSSDAWSGAFSCLRLSWVRAA